MEDSSELVIVKDEVNLCCSKAEVLLVDDVLFNLMPLKAIIEI